MFTVAKNKTEGKEFIKSCCRRKPSPTSKARSAAGSGDDASQQSPFWQADRHRKRCTTSSLRHHAVRLHQELEVHDSEQPKRLGQGDEPLVSEKVPVDKAVELIARIKQVAG